MKHILIYLLFITGIASADVVIDGTSLSSAEKSIMEIQTKEPDVFPDFSKAYSLLLETVDATKVMIYYKQLDGMTAKQVIEKANKYKSNSMTLVADYIPKIELYKVTATRNARGEPRIDFKLKNTGNKTLESVKVTFWFKDKNGVVIHEGDYYPITKRKTPLKPNYIWKQSSGRTYGGDDVPSEWKEGSFEAKITAIAFIKES